LLTGPGADLYQDGPRLTRGRYAAQADVAEMCSRSYAPDINGV